MAKTEPTKEQNEQANANLLAEMKAEAFEAAIKRVRRAKVYTEDAEIVVVANGPECVETIAKFPLRGDSHQREAARAFANYIADAINAQ